MVSLLVRYKQLELVTDCCSNSSVGYILSIRMNAKSIERTLKWERA